MKIHLLVWLSGCVLLLGCESHSPEKSLLADYRARLARVLDVDKQEPRIIDFVRYPKRRALTLSQASSQLDLLEFLKLSPCRVQRIIGERNSSLGRVMSHSQQWLYEARFIVAGRECLQQLLADPDYVQLQAKLQAAIDSKVAERRLVTWNATFASREFQQLFSQSAGPIGLDDPKPGELVDALARLRWLLDRWHSADIAPGDDLESAYQVIGAENWLGQLMATLLMVNAELEVLNAMQAARLEGRPLCFKGQSNRAGDIMHNVFLKYYIGQVQPYLARIYQQGDSVISEVNKIQYLTSPADGQKPAVFDEYWAQSWNVANGHSHWIQFKDLLREHTRHWQSLLQQCGLMPGS